MDKLILSFGLLFTFVCMMGFGNPQAQTITVQPIQGDDINATVISTTVQSYDDMVAQRDAQQEVIDRLTQEQQGEWDAYDQRIAAEQAKFDTLQSKLDTASTAMGKQAPPVKKIGG